MSQVGTLEGGSRHELRVGLSPDAPDESDFRDDGKGAFGYAHSYETSSRYDGPGLRVVLFLSGCLLRCKYCHNPDTWHLKDGTYVSAQHVLDRLNSFAPALRALDGGLTISGGEPMVQLEFTRRIFAGAKQMKLHTAIETSGFLGARADDDYLANIDLILLDIKSSDPETYRKATGRELAPTLEVRGAPRGDGKARVDPVHAGAGAHRRSGQCRGHRQIRRADEERPVGRGPAVPPDGRVQMEGDENRL